MALNKQTITCEINKAQLLAIKNMFDQVPKQVKKQTIWTKFWRENTKPLIKAAQGNAPMSKKPHLSPRGNVEVMPGTLKKSIGFFTTKASKKYLGGYVDPRVKGAFSNYGKSGWYGAFVEYGDEVMHYGKFTGRANRYMHRAWKQGKGAVLSNGMKDAEKIFGRVMKSHEKRMAKYGRLGY